MAIGRLIPSLLHLRAFAKRQGAMQPAAEHISDEEFIGPAVQL